MNEPYESCRRERQRQEMLREQGKFAATCATTGEDEMSDDECMTVLTEEVGEVAREINEGRKLLVEGTREERVEHVRHLREELVQTMAVCAAWVERIDYYSREEV